ncbi:succinyldiaminopimelate transaminase [Aliarcobacter butzleri]|uniref:succinyldiaminopimelate transaminase n=1 Tax=Aliarcobacter butzleri TaxID=28197 RepID=UPI00125EBA6C|nr:succinyldiaminopimelate transaminase [Aliarcobacter butzleri]MCG3673552.1 succinyldiaminopimelate transaminase [Aliarcobacter butzleri]MCT7620165.1 succinyldiaminopimelate transaminase [Aliarcobacter butzleri]MDN5094471.1 succinyldiaminopimelate transaminase [Aliarcobacter butzleri]MDN5094568.1 succinyldiaminopimelate transaminase [Aliarcobacter butzleri]
MNFEKYPFEKLNELLKDIVPNEKYELSVLTIGEPKFETPQFIQDKLKETSSFLRKYPSTIGEPFLRESMINFVKNRFNVSLKMSQIIPTFGTREVLFNFPQFALFDKKNPVIAFTNPFYQIYEGAAIASRAEVIHINLTKENNFKANLSDEELKRCDLVILNFPNNPTSASMDIDELGIWVKKALEFDFILVNDECYSEIYFEENTKPASLLEASIKVGNSEFKNVLVMNSISKRSSAPGLRSGFIAGDETILKDYLQYRTYIGCASPVPLQEAAAVAWNEQNHVAEFRKIYKRNFEIAQEILGIPTPEATFYIWLEVENDLEFTKNLYKEKNIKVLPGSFLGRGGLGKEYVRIALVENEEKTKESLKRLKDFIDG